MASLICSQEIQCQNMFGTQAYNSFTTHSLESWGQGQSRGVSEPRLGLLMEPALFRGGSVHRTIHNTNLWKFGVFSLKMHQFVRENLGSRR